MAMKWNEKLQWNKKKYDNDIYEIWQWNEMKYDDEMKWNMMIKWNEIW